ncbi:MAG: 2-C-methyl-D-erythritol 4-phosphate cytidylyltransferase, partial [Clostridia bacterium]|nr:2-C-methyl-D-erythritol 4-phosphate cytidylyltransferase [Clostridia bacterium]
EPVEFLLDDGSLDAGQQKFILGDFSEIERNAVTVTSAYETIITVDENENVEDVVDRKRAKLARAPQAFRLKDIHAAHIRAREEKFDAIDSATLMRHYGHKLFTVEGPVENIKITSPSDFYIFRAIYEARENSQIWGL